jgi:VWFA-related protein
MVMILALCLALMGLVQDEKREPEYYESFQVRVHQVQVTVRDRQGNPVKDLTAEDFSVFMGGKRQEIDSVIPISITDDEDIADETAMPRSTVPRLFVLLFDMKNLGRYLESARQAAREFVTEKTHAGDMVSVFYLGDAGVHMATAFTRDREVLANALSAEYRISMATYFRQERNANPSNVLEGLPLDDPELGYMIQMIRGLIAVRQASLLRQYAYNFSTLANALGLVSGRKNVLLFSGGASLPGNLDGAISMTSDIYRIVDELHRSGCVVYSVDTSRTMPLSRKGSDLFTALSLDTGGEVYMNAHTRMGEVLDTIERNNRHYYLVNIRTDMDVRKGKLVRLRIKVDRKGVRVRAPRALQLNPDLEKANVLQKALIIDEYCRRHIDIKPDFAAMRAYPILPTGDDALGVRVALEISGDLLVDESKIRRRPSPRKLEIFTLALEPETRRVLRTRHHLVSVMPHQVNDVLRETGFKHYSDIVLDPGHYIIKTIVRDLKNGRTLSLSDDIVLREQISAVGPLPLSGKRWVIATPGQTNEDITYDGAGISSGMSLAAELDIDPGEPVMMTFLFEENLAQKNGLSIALVLTDEDNRTIKVPPDALDATVRPSGEGEPASCQIELDTRGLGLQKHQRYLVQARISVHEQMLAEGSFDLFLAGF